MDAVARYVVSVLIRPYISSCRPRGTCDGESRTNKLRPRVVNSSPSRIISSVRSRKTRLERRYDSASSTSSRRGQRADQTTQRTRRRPSRYGSPSTGFFALSATIATVLSPTVRSDCVAAAHARRSARART